MEKIDKPDIPFWVFKNLTEYSGIKHFVSGRKGGVSGKNKDELNLGNYAVDEQKNINTNRELLKRALGLKQSVLFPAQMHSGKVSSVTRNTVSNSLYGIDSLITNDKNIMIAVLIADCVPVLLYEPYKKVIGVVHSGWRGASAEIVINTINEMKAVYNVNAYDIIAGVGPSIGPDVYEVGKEVAEIFRKLFPENNDVLRPATSKKYYLNLPLIVYYQLIKAGVSKENIELSGLCTYQFNNEFFSARRKDFGRFAAGIMLLD